MTLGKRIQAARQAAGLTQRELALRLGVSQATVHRWERGVSSSCKCVADLADVCGVDPVWLDTGEGDPMNILENSVLVEEVPIPLPKPRRRGRPPLVRGDGARVAGKWPSIPVIPWEVVHRFAQGQPSLHKGEIETRVTPSCLVGPNAFALRIVGDSMETEFSEQDIIVLDPDRPSGHNSYVVVAHRDGRVMFRRLSHDGGMRFLLPCNERYPVVAMDGFCTIVAVLRYKYREYSANPSGS